MYARSALRGDRDRIVVVATIASIALTWIVSAAPAHAEAASNDSAKQLVEDARELMAEQHFDAACSKLETSQGLDPELATQFQLADCYEHAGKIASAWRQFRQMLSAANDGDAAEQRQKAQQRVNELEPRLSYLTIDTWKGQRISVRRDGVPIDEAALGTALPLDPGPHVIEASAPGKRSWSTRVILAPLADRVTVSIPILRSEDLSIALAADGELEQSTPSAAAAAATTSDGSVQRTLAIAAAALGVGGIATGAVFGLKAAANWSAAKAHCNPYPYCGDAGPRLSADAAQSGTISTLSFVTGGLGLVSGALLWFTAPSSRSEARTSLHLDPGAVRVRGRF